MRLLKIFAVRDDILEFCGSGDVDFFDISAISELETMIIGVNRLCPLQWGKGIFQIGSVLLVDMALAFLFTSSKWASLKSINRSYILKAYFLPFGVTTTSSSTDSMSDSEGATRL